MKQVYSFTLLDPADLLPRVNGKTLRTRHKQIQEVRDFTLSFMTVLHAKNMHFQFLGEEGKEHELRFLAKNGMVEFFFYPPVIIRSYFTRREDANMYAKELKSFLKKELDDPKMDILLESLIVKKHSSALEPHIRQRLHQLYLKKGLAYTAVAFSLVLLLEIISKATEEFLIHQLGLGSLGTSLFAIKVVIGTILVAFILEPVKEKVENFLEKFLP